MGIVLQVVADDEGWPVLTGTAATNALARAEGLDDNTIAEDDLVAAPGWAGADGVVIILGEARIVDEFGFDVFEMGAGLMGRVGDDPDVGFALFECGAERKCECADGGLCATARPEDVEPGTARVVCAIDLFGQPVVHGGRRFCEMIGQIFLAPFDEACWFDRRGRFGWVFQYFSRVC